MARVWDHTRREGVDDPGAFPVAPDLVEALVWLERTAEASTIASRLRDLAERQEHPWGLATARRCAAVIRLASGYDEQAAEELADAAASYGELGLGFDQARSLLWLGREARRARKRAMARRVLQAAAADFDALGADGWTEQARAELGLLGARVVTPMGVLTTAEQRVVELAAAGLSNKEIAKRLFVAVHTVEVHLGHAYAKLGVRSRAQLAAGWPHRPNRQPWIEGFRYRAGRTVAGILLTVHESGMLRRPRHWLRPGRPHMVRPALTSLC